MRFIIRRLGFYVVAAWAAMTVNFLIPHLLPATRSRRCWRSTRSCRRPRRRALDIQFGLGHQGSLLHQYGVYLGHLAHGNLGISVLDYPASVVDACSATRCPGRSLLVGSATIISFVTRNAARDPRRLAARRLVRPARCRPSRFLQAIALLLPRAELALQSSSRTDLHLFPGYGGYTLGDTVGFNGTFIASALSHSILPALTIIVTSMAGWMLQMRNVMITTIGEDYVLAAEAKGLSTRRDHVHLRGAQRDPAEHRGLRAGDRLRHRGRARDGDRVLLSRRRLPALQRRHPR